MTLSFKDFFKWHEITGTNSDKKIKSIDKKRELELWSQRRSFQLFMYLYIKGGAMCGGRKLTLWWYKDRNTQLNDV